MFAEEHARLLLVLHTALAVAAVGASTHLVLWLRKIRRGAFGRLRAARRFAWIVAALHGGAFVAGNLMYPTYKVAVKVSYLQNPDAVVAGEAEARARVHEATTRFGDPETPAPADLTMAERIDLTERADKIARWFDSKEHWVAMGLVLSLALAFLLPVWRPEPGEGAEIGGFVYGMAIAAAGTLWFGAIVGVLTSAWRAV